MADSNKDETIIKEALEKFEESVNGSDHNRTDYEEDIRFGRMGEQWPDPVRAQRKAENRPCLTINKIPAFVRQVVNDSRQNKPAIQVHPVDNGADPDTAEVINGLVRSIERKSQADVAYDTAIDHSVSGGFGFFRIGIDYCHADTFDMEARIDRIANPMAVNWDITTTRFDAEDWRYAFISEWFTEEQFKAEYPDAEPVSFQGDDRDYTSSWVDGDRTRVAEYFCKEDIHFKLLLLSDGRAIKKEDLDKDEELQAFMDINGIQVINERDSLEHKVYRRVISGVEVLEEDIWPGQLIPICPVWGEEVMDIGEGKRWVRSMIRDARDSQQMFNYWRTASTELVALAPKAPFMLEKGAIPKGDEKKWKSVNNRSFPYLEYERGYDAPKRQPFAGVPAGALQESLNASDDMKSIIGIYDSSLGARSNETSGRAIMARQREADISNFHFIDNLSRAIQYAGRVLVEIIPSIYSARQSIRILGEDMKEKVINLTTEGGGYDENNNKLYDLSVGKYDVTVKAGPSYATQREETREALIEIMSRVPNAGPYIGDIVMEHMDFQNADKVAKRLKMLLPENVQKMEAEDGVGENITPEAQQLIGQKDLEIAQLRQQLEQGVQVLNEAQEKAKTLEDKAILENKKLDIEAGKINQSVSNEAMKLENERIKLEMERSKLADEVGQENRLAALEQNVQNIAGAITNTNREDAEMTAMLMEALNAPQEVVRGEDGKIIRIEPSKQEIEL